MNPRFSEAPTYRDFAYVLKDSLEDFLGRYGGLRERIIKFLRSVKGISISQVSRRRLVGEAARDWSLESCLWR